MLKNKLLAVIRRGGETMAEVVTSSSHNQDDDTPAPGSLMLRCTADFLHFLANLPFLTQVHVDKYRDGIQAVISSHINKLRKLLPGEVDMSRQVAALGIILVCNKSKSFRY